MQNLYSIFSQFDVPGNTPVNFYQDGKNGLSQVYFIDKKYVLRGRSISDKIYEDFQREQSLLDIIVDEGFIHPIKLPRLIPTKLGDFCFLEGAHLWTLAEFIPGEILCGISDISILKDSDRDLYVKGLFEIQQKTQILKPEISSYQFIAGFREKYYSIQNHFTQAQRGMIEKITLDLSDNQDGLTCFVHGDFHPGNIVISNDRKSISGIIDLDWCHVGSIYEDLSLIILCYMRDITQKHFIYSEDVVIHYMKLYPGSIELQKLKKYILLRSIHDLSIFIPRTGGWMRKMESIQKEIIKSLLNNLYT